VSLFTTGFLLFFGALAFMLLTVAAFGAVTGLVWISVDDGVEPVDAGEGTGVICFLPVLAVCLVVSVLSRVFFSAAWLRPAVALKIIVSIIIFFFIVIDLR